MSVHDRLFGQRAIVATTKLDTSAVRRLGVVGQHIASLAHPDPSQRDAGATALKEVGLTAVDPLVSALTGGIGELDADARRRAAGVIKSTLNETHLGAGYAEALITSLESVYAQGDAELQAELLPALAGLCRQLLHTASSDASSDRELPARRRAAAALASVGEPLLTEALGQQVRWAQFIVELRRLEVDRRKKEGFESVFRQLGVAPNPSLYMEDSDYGDREADLVQVSRRELAEALARDLRRGHPEYDDLHRSLTVTPVPERQRAWHSESAGRFIVEGGSQPWDGAMPVCLRISAAYWYHAVRPSPGRQEVAFDQTLVWRVADDEYLVWGSVSVAGKRRSATEWESALSQLPEAERRTALMAGLTSDSAEVRQASTQALGTLGGTEADSVEPLIELLSDQDPRVREGAAIALGTLGDPRAVDPLIEALLDEDDSVQYKVTEALRAIAGIESRLLSTDRKGRVPRVGAKEQHTSRLIAERQLLKLEELAVTRFSAALTDRSASPARRASAGRGLKYLVLDNDHQEAGFAGENQDRANEVRARAVALLSDALHDEADSVRQAAAEALRRHAPWIPLVDKLSDTDAAARQQAEGALQSLADPAAIDTLIPLLGHPDGDVAAAAARTLTRLGDARGSAWIMIDAARRDERGLYERAARNLERAGADAVPLLRAAAHDENAAVRWSVAHVLGRSGAEEAVPLLIELLDDADEGVREAALAGLERIGGRDAQAAIAAHGQT